MKYSILVLLSIGSALSKCVQEGVEQGSKKVGREVVENGSKTIGRNLDEIAVRVTTKTAQYLARDFNKENPNVFYDDSTNTFIVSNEME